MGIDVLCHRLRIMFPFDSLMVDFLSVGGYFVCDLNVVYSV